MRPGQRAGSRAPARTRPPRARSGGTGEKEGIASKRRASKISRGLAWTRKRACFPMRGADVNPNRKSPYRSARILLPRGPALVQALPMRPPSGSDRSAPRPASRPVRRWRSTWRSCRAWGGAAVLSDRLCGRCDGLGAARRVAALGALVRALLRRARTEARGLGEDRPGVGSSAHRGRVSEHRISGRETGMLCVTARANPTQILPDDEGTTPRWRRSWGRRSS